VYTIFATEKDVLLKGVNSPEVISTGDLVYINKRHYRVLFKVYDPVKETLEVVVRSVT
jgi:hypothetical protein